MTSRELARALGLAGLGLALFGTSPGAAEPTSGDFAVRLECQRRPTPGRVLCEAELEVERGMLVWADVLVLEAPSFAPPLRARVGPSALFMKTDQRQRLQLALAATEAGRGTLAIRARAVRCPDGSGRDCEPVTREARAVVSVGPITD
jgi:hypothetical protein